MSVVGFRPLQPRGTQGQERFLTGERDGTLRHMFNFYLSYDSVNLPHYTWCCAARHCAVLQRADRFGVDQSSTLDVNMSDTPAAFIKC